MKKLTRLWLASACVLCLGGLPTVSGQAVAQPSTPSSTRKSEGLAETERLIQQSISLAKRGLFEAAIAMAEEAVIERVNLLGNAHLEVANALDNLAEIYYLEGDYLAATIIYDRALIITAGTGNTNSLESADRIQAAAEAYKALADYESAIRLYNIALSVREELLGPTHPEVALTLDKFAALYRQQGDTATALLIEERSQAIKQTQQ